MRSRGRRAPGSWAVTVAAALLVGAGAAAQEPPELRRVDTLVADGRIAQARQELQEWWDTRWGQADRQDRQHGLWLRGVLTVDPSQALRDYQRLVLEYPGGRYAARALHRLAQAAEARERTLEAAGHYEQLVQEYPDTPEQLEARRWLDEHRDAVSRARTDTTTPEPPDTVELEAEEEAPVRQMVADRFDAPDLPVAVQLGAFSTVERARIVAEEAREEGFDVRLVRVEGSELVRVRAGHFPDRSAARDLRDRLRGTGMDAVIVTDAREERPIP